MYEKLVYTLRYDAGWLEQGMTQTEHDIAEHLKKAADAIEGLSRQRDRAYDRLCGWCHVCPLDKRNPEGCEFAALIEEAAEDTNVFGKPYVLYDEEGRISL